MGRPADILPASGLDRGLRAASWALLGLTVAGLLGAAALLVIDEASAGKPTATVAAAADGGNESPTAAPEDGPAAGGR